MAFLVYNAVITALYSAAGFSFLHLPWAPITIIGTAVAFIVSFQNNAAYDRIWEARKIWGGIVNTSRTWGMQTDAMISNHHALKPVSEEALQAYKKQLVYRHIAWLTALRHAMRTNKPWEVFANSGTNKEWIRKMNIPEQVSTLDADLTPYLSPAEKAHVLSKSNKSMAILNLQSTHLKELHEHGLVWEFSFLELQNLLEEMFTLQGKSERIKNFPYPKQYASLSYYFVRLFVLLLPFGAIPEFAKISTQLTPTFPLFAPYFVWFSVLFCVLASWVFYTMERIGRAGENPFEGTANDVPISTIARGIEIDLREALGEDKESIPKQFAEHFDIQM